MTREEFQNIKASQIQIAKDLASLTGKVDASHSGGVFQRRVGMRSLMCLSQEFIKMIGSSSVPTNRQYTGFDEEDSMEAFMYRSARTTSTLLEFIGIVKLLSIDPDVTYSTTTSEYDVLFCNPKQVKTLEVQFPYFAEIAHVLRVSPTDRQNAVYRDRTAR